MTTTRKTATSAPRPVSGAAVKATKPAAPVTPKTAQVAVSSRIEARSKKVIVPPPKPRHDGLRVGQRTPKPRAG